MEEMEGENGKSLVVLSAMILSQLFTYKYPQLAKILHMSSFLSKHNSLVFVKALLLLMLLALLLELSEA